MLQTDVPFASFQEKKKNSSFAVPALPFVSTKRRLHCLHHFLFSTHALFEVATHTTRNLSCCASRPVFSFCTHGKSAAYKEESDGRKPTTRPLKKKNGKTKLVAAYKHVAIRTARECVTHSSVLLQQHPIILFYFPFSSLARFAITAPFFFFGLREIRSVLCLQIVEKEDIHVRAREAGAKKKKKKRGGYLFHSIVLTRCQTGKEKAHIRRNRSLRCQA